MSYTVPNSASAVFTIAAGDGSRTVEVCREGQKFVVVQVMTDTGQRLRRSRQPMSFERAKNDATYLATVRYGKAGRS